MADPHPPYVIFETRAVEDRTASIDAGHYVSKDVIYAIITPAGSKDRVEKVAEDWIKDMEEGVRQERIPAAWVDIYKSGLKAWEKNHENPEIGTPVREWPVASPAQVKMLLDCGVVSVEQVAEMTEEAMGRLGMGGRALKSKAEAWLEAAKGTGVSASEIEALRQANADFETRAKTAEDALKTLQTQMKNLETRLAAADGTRK
jgi:hypothetical protein